MVVKNPKISHRGIVSLTLGEPEIHKAAQMIVVGAGSAGCLVAAEIVRQTNLRVTLIESPKPAACAAACTAACTAARTTTKPATNPVASSVAKQRPARWLELLQTDLDRNLATRPCESLAGRTIRWPRGIGIGGSSQINAMIWTPPTNTDLDRLQAQSGKAWSQRELTDALEAVEQIVKPETPRWHSEAAAKFLQVAGQTAGQDDVPMLYRRFNRQGQRWTADQFLSDSIKEGRIQIIRANVDRILHDGNRASGVVAIDPSGQPLSIESENGVIVSAGTIGSPAILMRSGIEIDQIGANLQDHLLMPVIFQVRHANFSAMQNSMQDIARWQHAGTGRLASNLAECGGLFHVSDGDDSSSDQWMVQLHVTPTNYLTHPVPTADAMMSIGVNLTCPQSRGSISLDPDKPLSGPLIETGYLSDPDDLRKLVRSIGWLRSWLASGGTTEGNSTHSFDWVESEVLPGKKRSTEKSLARSIARYAQTLYHPVGTCVVGGNEKDPVDANFQVRGKTGLWVVDASVFKQIPQTNPSATLMMVAKLASHRIAAAIQRRN